MAISFSSKPAAQSRALRPRGLACALAVAVLATLGAASAHAQAAGPAQGAQLPAEQLARAIAAAEQEAAAQRLVAQAAQGDYKLKDGRSLAVAGTAKRLRVVVDARRSLVLMPVGPLTWATADGRVQLSFEPSANGLVTDLRFSELG